ncbi:MAG: hypothetical protein IKU30_03410 [Clostridia bacterium]|nr:hypothetical protein [Clostridia bacterium]
MGRGSSGIGRFGGGGGLNPANVSNVEEMISQRETNRSAVDQVLRVSQDMYDRYGAQTAEFQTADIKGKDANTLAYYDGANITVNNAYFDPAQMDSAYDRSVSDGFHPGRGDKTGLEAVAAHEFGHLLTDRVATAMGLKSGLGNIDAAATKIVTEAKAATSHRGVVQMAAKISRYATHSNAEAVAEAASDYWCNGNNAKAESIAIMNVVNKYIGKK